MAITQRQDGKVTMLNLDGLLTADRVVPAFRETIRTLLEAGGTLVRPAKPRAPGRKMWPGC